jgi:hypothetical protein
LQNRTLKTLIVHSGYTADVLTSLGGLTKD